MSSELELLRQHITEFEVENAKLRQIIEENTKREAENIELKSKVGELEARLVILERSPPIGDGQPQNDKEVSSEVSAVVVSDSTPIHEVHSQLKLSEQIEEIPDQEETSEDMETDAFLVEVYNKSISNEIRKRNKEKKHSKAVEDQVSLQKISDTASGISSSEKLGSTKNGQGLIQEITRNFDESTTSSSIQENDSTCALSLNPPEISLISGKENIIWLYQKASNAEGLAMKANQEEILSWYNMANGKVGEKKAKGQVYDFIIQQLPDTQRDNLCKQTQRAIKIFDLFKKIGIDKVQYIKTYSANSISKITNEELQKTEISPTLGRQNHVISKTNQTNTSTKSEVSVPTAPIPSSHDSNPSGDSSKIGPDNSPVIPYDARASYINVALKEYPYLSLFNSDIHNDGYEFKNSGLCPGGKEHNKGKINNSPEMISSATSNASVPSASSRTPIPRTNPNKMECLYQYAIEHGLDPEKFLIVTEADKKRWAGESFRGILEVDMRFYCGAIKRKEDPRKYHKFLTDRERMIGEELLRHDILKHRSSTAWLDDLMKEWENPIPNLYKFSPRHEYYLA
ncbi:hypothetical protein C1645_743700 [Glomus cerebriforme]|uniref:Uncharacterized protein n=1 Tax=Glomus cerebriforme TaxID=658196 RepID=A0A397SAS7_9GLOM|nr:hypothetical protein C1645_743700 [Glomus cerebriforme]